MATAEPVRVSARAAEPSDWKTLRELFGPKGACAGCWCMYWRIARGTDFQRDSGAPNERAFKKLFLAGAVHGTLAFAGDGEEAVGWCALGPRADFARLLKHRTIPADGGENTWAVVCFFVRAGWRARGVGRALLASAVELARERGAPALEGYPVAVTGDARYPATFAYTGVPALYARAGFRDVTPEGSKRLVFRRSFRAKKRA